MLIDTLPESSVGRTIQGVSQKRPPKIFGHISLFDFGDIQFLRFVHIGFMALINYNDCVI